MPRYTRAAALGATAILSAATLAVATTSSANADGADHHGTPLDHIYVIMLENHSQSSGIDDHYFGVTHPSMPNYLAFLGGDNFGLQDDNDQNVANLDRTNLVDQLEAHHVSWDAYFDTLPANKLDRFGPTLPDGTTASLYA